MQSQRTDLSAFRREVERKRGKGSAGKRKRKGFPQPVLAALERVQADPSLAGIFIARKKSGEFIPQQRFHSFDKCFRQIHGFVLL